MFRYVWFACVVARYLITGFRIGKNPFDDMRGVYLERGKDESVFVSLG